MDMQTFPSSYTVRQSKSEFHLAILKIKAYRLDARILIKSEAQEGTLGNPLGRPLTIGKRHQHF